MRARIVALHGLWAIQPEGGRPEFTRFPLSVDPERVRVAVQKEFRDWEIQPVLGPGWLFELEELREHELESAPLFGEELR